VKFSRWLQQNNFSLHILVCRHFGQWGFECQIIKSKKSLEGKDIFLTLVTGPLAHNEDLPATYPNKKISGFGVDKFSSIEGLVTKVSGKSLCYPDQEIGYVLVEVPEDISTGDQEEYAGLIKGQEAAN
jgi:hypothetical protein